MFDIENFRTYDFGKSVIEDMRLWYRTDDNTYTSLGFDAGFFNNPDCPYYSFGCDLFPEEFQYFGKIIGAEIQSFDISVIEPEKRYSVKLSYTLDGQHGQQEFSAKNVSFNLYKYLGMSYRNMYDTWEKDLEKCAYVECADYFKEEETEELEDGYTLNIKTYSDIEVKSPQYKIMKASLRRCVLFKDGKQVYQWVNTDSSNPYTFFGFIYHSNGHRYFPFHIDLYGISYLDLESGEVYHYIPEGYRHPVEWTLGESFIITSVNYDKDSNLVAYEGCYWAGPGDVMVGDLSNPLGFDPHLVSVHEILDPEYDEIDDVDFVSFSNGNLIVKCDYKTEREVSLDMLFQKIKEKAAEK